VRNFGTIAGVILLGGALLIAPISRGFSSGAREQADRGGAEQTLFAVANQERKARGLSTLAWDDALANAARQHAVIMAQHSAISHQFAGEPDLTARLSATGARFSEAAENVAFGPTAPGIHDGWMKSPPHRANLLNPDLTSLGIGVAERDGTLYAVQDFSKSVASLTLDAQERRVSAKLAELAQRGLQISDNRAEARRACMLGRQGAAGARNLLLFQYTSSDLDMLPRNLEEEIRNGHYRTAEVGACASGVAAGGFSNYKIAVLLYE
jgi:hypothetical protein